MNTKHCSIRKMFVPLIFYSLFILSCTINVQNIISDGKTDNELTQDKPVDVKTDTKVPLVN